MTTTAVEPFVLQEGTQAPVFNNVLATGNQSISLADYAGRYVILVFYPKDSTPGCTKQLCALRDDIAIFEKLNTAIFGVNPGSLESHERFVEKQSYPFPILVDADKEMARQYGALKPEGGIQRTVYIIGPQGQVVFAQQGMPTDEALALAIQAHGG